jgi:hypothetical protein
MTFDLIRAGWPNTAAILALALMPIVALATGGDRRSAAVRAEQIETAAICLTLAECAVVAAAEVPETILQ